MCVRACSQVRPVRLFVVLARNRQSAVGLLGGTKSAREQPPRVSTIPPRQQLSITIWLAIRRCRVTYRGIRMGIRIKLNVITEREREREKEKEIQNERFGESTLPRNGNETFDGTRTKHPTEGEICTQPPKKHTKTYTRTKYNRNTDKTHTQRETHRRESPHTRIYPKSAPHSFRWEKIQNFLTFTALTHKRCLRRSTTKEPPQ